MMIRAESDAEAERIRADGAKRAAELLCENAVAVELAKIGRFYRDTPAENFKAEAHIHSITTQCWHQYTCKGEGMFTF